MEAQTAGQKPNLALIPGDSAKVAEVVYCDAAGVQLAEGAFGSRANRNPQSGDSAIFGRCSNMPASTSPRGHFFHRQGEPPVSNWAGGYRQPDVAHLAGPVSVRLPRSSNNPQQGGVSRVLFFGHHRICAAELGERECANEFVKRGLGESPSRPGPVHQPPARHVVQRWYGATTLNPCQYPCGFRGGRGDQRCYTSIAVTVLA